MISPLKTISLKNPGLLTTFIGSMMLNMLMIVPASATSMLPLSLEQISSRANLIFHGRVIENNVAKDNQSGQIATFTEFEVIELIKGDTGDSHTIKQIGGQLKETGTTLRIHGVPRYTVGKTYVVFLPEKSSLGFSSPLGLHQGSFTVNTVDGEQVVSNGQALDQQAGHGAKNVQLPLAVDPQNRSQARLADFIDTVRTYNAQ